MPGLTGDSCYYDSNPSVDTSGDTRTVENKGNWAVFWLFSSYIACTVHSEQVGWLLGRRTNELYS